MAPDVEKRYTLVVRGPAQDLLYEHFSRLFEGRDGVMVVRDRRRAQRRHGGVAGAARPPPPRPASRGPLARAAGVAHLTGLTVRAASAA